MASNDKSKELNDEKSIENLKNQIKELKNQINHKKKDLANIPENILQTISNEKTDLYELKTSPDLISRKELTGHFGKIYSLDWASNSSEIVSASQDGKLLIWNVESTDKILAISLKTAFVLTCAYSTSSTFVASGGLDTQCSVYPISKDVGWEINTPMKVLRKHEGYLSCCKFIDDVQIITSSGDATCILWDIEKGAHKTIFSEHSSDVECLALLDENVFASGAGDKFIKIWDIRQKNDSVASFKDKTEINSVAWFPDSLAFASGNDDSSIKLWDLRSYGPINTYEDPEISSGITDLGFTKSGYLLFSSYDDAPTCLAWNTMTGKKHKVMQHPAKVATLQVAPDGYSLATGCWDKVLRAWA